MYASRLQLTDFRSYRSVDIAIEPGVSAFIGPNGQGKTNLVEAIEYVAMLGSHRVATDQPLVRLGADRAVVRLGVVRDDRALLAEVEINPGRANRARVNKTVLPRASELLGMLRVVLFAPDDVAIVKGDPSGRRGFLDALLVAQAPRFAGVRQDYDRVLKQRNALLKTAAQARRQLARGEAPDLRTLDVWDAHLARAGAELLAGRLRLVESIRPLVDKAYQEVAPSGATAGMEYKCTAGDDLGAGNKSLLEAALLAQMSAARGQEVERGVSLVGPHRDDLILSLGEIPTRGYASHGESWSFALALRLAAYDLLSADGAEPVLILDDVFAELDADRRRRLAERVVHAQQVIITAAVVADVPELLDGARYDVMDSEVHRVR